jgi:micrococcal nuclease
MPSYQTPGATFRGVVTTVLDGDSLCVAHGSGNANLIEVRLADFNAPELSASGGRAAQAALASAAMGQSAICTAGARTYDRVAAYCTINGKPVSALLRSSGAAEGGSGMRRPASVQEGRRLAPPSLVVERPEPRSGLTRMFKSCAQARAAGAAPLHQGAPGYNPRLDGDGDGVACEPYRGR